MFSRRVLPRVTLCVRDVKKIVFPGTSKLANAFQVSGMIGIVSYAVQNVQKTFTKGLPAVSFPIWNASNVNNAIPTHTKLLPVLIRLIESVQRAMYVRILNMGSSNVMVLATEYVLSAMSLAAPGFLRVYHVHKILTVFVKLANLPAATAILNPDRAIIQLQRRMASGNVSW